MNRILLLIWPSLFFSCIAMGQDSLSLYNKLYNLPDRLFGAVNKKSEKLQNNLSKATVKYLSRLKRKELKMQRLLAKKDSAAARQVFGNVNEKYSQLQYILKSPAGALQKDYSGYLDSMQTSLRFLQGNGLIDDQLKPILDNYKLAQSKLDQQACLHQLLMQRQQMIKEKLQQTHLFRQLCKYQETLYYYRAQVDEYRRVFQDPHKMESLVLGAVTKIPAFQDFFNTQSQLSSLFQLPGGIMQPGVAMNEMQTREMIQQQMQQSIGSGPNANQFISGSMSNARNSINALKNKLNAGGTDDLPDFKPNDQKSKSFLKRLQVGTNFQSTKSNNFFPTTSDLGLSLGYKINPKSIAGVGASYKLGWGRDFRHISLSNQGVGLRSFVDWKLKGSFFISGGFEYNYQKPFDNITQVKNLDAWQQSGLLGLSKTVSLRSKTLKQTKAQLFWDFLSYRQRPVTPALKFRIGYDLK